DVGADAVLLQLPEVARDVDRAGAAVAGDDRGDALEEVGQVGPRGGLQERVVAVRVQVDEAGRDDQALAVEDARPVGDLELAQGDDPVAAERQVADHAGPAAAVVQGGAAEDDVGLDRGVGGEHGEEGQGGEGEHGGFLRFGA